MGIKLGSELRSDTVEHTDYTPSDLSPTPRYIPFARPSIDDNDIAAVVGVLQSGWITTGPRVQEFEAAFAARLGVRHAIAVNSATAALHLALEAAGVGPGDEVIVPDLTFTATAEVVRYLDAIPVIVDVRPDTLCISPEAIEAAITPRTKAIVPVHLAGHMAEMDAIMALASSRGLVVVEDAAHSLPAAYHGRPAGTIGHFGAFSFYATKTITTGEGGMLVTDDDAYADHARMMALHGMSRDAWKRYAPGGSWRYDVVAPGFKYNMTDIAAALGISQLRKADALWLRRTQLAALYDDAFRSVPEIQVPRATPGIDHSWHLYAIRLHLDRLQASRDDLIDALAALGVGTSVHFIPLHMFTYYRGLNPQAEANCPVASREFDRMLSLPIYPDMSPTDVDHVAEQVIRWIGTHRCA